MKDLDIRYGEDPGDNPQNMLAHIGLNAITHNSRYPPNARVYVVVCNDDGNEAHIGCAIHHPESQDDEPPIDGRRLAHDMTGLMQGMKSLFQGVHMTFVEKKRLW